MMTLATFTFTRQTAFGSPCYPTDPTGNNPDNPCLVYPPPGIRSDSFVRGEARPVRETPTVANPAGQILIAPRAGFWTGSQTTGSTRTITTNNGHTYTLNK